MQSTLLCGLLLFLIGASLAHPMPDDMTMKPTAPPKYPLNLEGGGGGQRGDGLGFRVRGHEKLWTSDNGRHEIGVNGEYGQRLGGRYGTSQPSWNVGTTYTYRFPNF
ncbi:diptericin A-like [Drosophila takahashii]|uniref:diptericin A-like n=1 Tax=Drosophila takahashii TaxID=29030 RepID=UPI0007E6B7E4|nr:diptericin A-like [Drosophila takahashii]